MKIGEIIKTRRKELGLTQEQIAGFLGVTAPAVHKWEKGISYPDISTLPALARLLKADMNTLFSFEEELTETEVNAFSNDVIGRMQKEGFAAGYEMAMEKIRQFPNCSLLLCSVAALLDGALLLFSVENTDKYEAAIENMYERSLESSDGRIRDQAIHMLVIKYMRREEFEQAERLLETLPDMPVDKKNLKALLCMNQGKRQEAIRVLEEQLWYFANQVQATLISLMRCFFEMEKEEEIRICVQKIKDMTESFGLWNYNSYVAEFQMAYQRKDREKIMLSLRKMLKAMQTPYDRSGFPLYAELENTNQEGNHMKLIASKMIEELNKEYALDEKESLEFQELLRKL